MVLCVAGLSMLLAGCRGKTRQVRHVSPPPSSPAPSLNDATLGWHDYRIVYPSQGPPEWVADVKLGRGDAKTGITTLHGITCRMYRDGKAALQVKADDGKAALQGKVARITLSGDVRATAVQGDRTLQADSLRWVTNEDTVAGQHLHLLAPTMELWADSGTVSLDLSRVKVAGKVRIESRDNK